jgi:hypothetical protein
VFTFKVVVDQIVVELVLEFSQRVKELFAEDGLVEPLEYCSLKTFTGAVEHRFADGDFEMLDVIGFEHLLEAMAFEL